MNKIWILAKREIQYYFTNPVAYIVFFMVLLISGAYFFYFDLMVAFHQQLVPPTSRLVYQIGTLLVMATPAITARLLAEEQRSGTIELLLSSPLRDSELVIGKWLGAFLFYLSILVITLIYPWILSRFVIPGLDKGSLIGGYLALILLAAALSAIGVAVSSFFRSQVSAFIASTGVLVFVWWAIGPLSQVLHPDLTLRRLLGFLNWNSHFFNDLPHGMLNFQDVIFFLSISALGIFLGTMSIAIQRWQE